MSTSYVDYSQINSLGEFNQIAGTDLTLSFTVTDEQGVPADLGSATCTWKLCPFGEPTVTTLTLNGTVVSISVFEIYLTSTNTATLSGKYTHQPIIVDGGKTYRPQQGIIIFTPAIS